MTRLPGYLQKLYPRNWNRISLRIKCRAGWKCEACDHENAGWPYTLTVHHIDGDPRHNEDDNLIALCQRCHVKAHALTPAPRTRLEVIQRLRNQGQQLYFR